MPNMAIKRITVWIEDEDDTLWFTGAMPSITKRKIEIDMPTDNDTSPMEITLKAYDTLYVGPSHIDGLKNEKAL